MIIKRGSLITTYIYNSVSVIGSAGISADYVDSDNLKTKGAFSLTINNPYIQDNGWAFTLAEQTVIESLAVGGLVVLIIRALPQLQLGDIVVWNKLNYICQRITTTFDHTNGMTQLLQLKKVVNVGFFTLDVSTLDDTDILF